MENFLDREILQEINFQNNGDTFSAYHKAEQWCVENGYLYGSMQRDAPIAICKGKEGYISKWGNLDDAQKIDGVILPSPGFREGNAQILILGARVSRVSVSHESRETPEYDFADGNERVRYLQEKGELGELIAIGSTRQCYQYANNPNLVIKVPLPGKEDDADWQSIQEAQEYLKRESLFLKIGESKVPRVARCMWSQENRILYMMKVTPIPGAGNLGMGPDGIAYIYDIF